MKYEPIKTEVQQIAKKTNAKVSNDFLAKVLKAGSLDTPKYRYIVKEVNGVNNQWVEIRRLPIAYLDTTAAINGWEIIATYGETD